jgi:putative transposase
MRFAFIDVERVSYPMRILCRVLEVSRSGYYAWCARKPSARDLGDERLRPKVVEAFKIGRGTYGSPRVRDELVDQGFEIGRKRVARLMRELGLQGVSPRKFRVTTDSDHVHPIAANVLDRDFEASGPNEKWATDITYVWTGEGWLYLAVVMDLFSRRKRRRPAEAGRVVGRFVIAAATAACAGRSSPPQPAPFRKGGRSSARGRL